MKSILIICPEFPYPSNSGDKLATHGYIMAAKSFGFDIIDLVCFAPNHNAINIEKRNIRKVFFLKKPNKINFATMVRFFMGESYLLNRYYLKDNADLVDEIISNGNYDKILAVQITVGQYIRNKTKCILSTEVLYGRAFAKNEIYEKNFIKRLFFRVEKERIEKYECLLEKEFNKVVFYSAEDKKYWQMKGYDCGNIFVLPLGLDLQDYPILEKIKNVNPCIGYYGNFTWYPTEDGLHYLLHDIWPCIKDTNPSCVLKIAGRGIPNWAKAFSNDKCKIVGPVDSMSDFVKGLDIVIAPVRIGGGVRLKILEGMAWGRPIIATDTAMEGNEINKLNKNIITANSPSEFAQQVQVLLKDNVLWNRQVLMQREYIKNKHDCKVCLLNLFK